VPFWWVNHKQTYRQEIQGRYIWSPKTKRDGSRNISYDNLRRVLPGDVVFSYAGGEIRQVGCVTRPAASCPQPSEFGHAGARWEQDGWIVPVDWKPVPHPLRPKSIITELRPHLPPKYSPLIAATGDGVQHLYLAALPNQMAQALLDHLGHWAIEFLHQAQGVGDDDGAVRGVDDALEARIQEDPGLDETTRRAVVDARRGQGRFRLSVEALERACRVTGVTDRRLLRASHIKPWRTCSSNIERLDGHNGLLLSPNVDHLFDRGYIAFLDDGQMLISPHVEANEIARLGIEVAPPAYVGRFNPGQATYLEFHRTHVFLHSY